MATQSRDKFSRILARIATLTLIPFSLHPILSASNDGFTSNDFESHIRPTLVESCHECHGPKKAESNLRLDSLAALLRGGESGPALIPGSPESSLLMQVLRHEGKIKMPKDGKLAPDTIAAFSRWIQGGAYWPESTLPSAPGPKLRSGPITQAEREFWSFLPLTDPALPVLSTTWGRNGIDHFIVRQLSERNLTPNPPTNKRTLIRRATFDLTGLPPTPDEIEAFLHDQRPDAFERVVDRLLSSKAYGERWGRHWLDVVRYADTAGETGDYPTPLSYQYRNWVINAFNRDQPYDAFIREQIAGDILAQNMSPPDWDESQRRQYREKMTATGYIAISRRFGFDIQNYHHLTIQDTIDNIGQAVLGLTLGCARCHDHKYDPVTTEDYYGWYGIFDSTQYSFPGSEEKKRPADLVPVLPATIAAKEQTLHSQRIARLESEVSNKEDELKKVQRAMGWTHFFEERRLAHAQENRDGHPGFHVWHANPLPILGINTSAKPLKVPGTVLPGELVVHPGERDGAGIGWRSPISGSIRISGRLSDAHHCGNGINWHLDQLAPAGLSPLASGEIDVGQNQALPPVSQEPGLTTDVKKGDFIQLSVFPRGSYGCDLTRIELKIETISGNQVWDLVHDLKQNPLENNPHSDAFNNPDVWYFFVAPVDRGKSLVFPTTTDFQAGELRRLPEMESTLKRELEHLHNQLADLKKTGPYHHLYAAIEKEEPRDARIQIRGQRDRFGASTPRRNLDVLGADLLPPDAGSGRLELADWLTRPSNPLTARVMVNRIWQQHFGRGLVATPNDFGTRGERPSHPELLDWLATRFVESGWSIKAMHRLMMNSAIYQQGSEYHPLAAEIDPDAAYLWRFNRRHLSAEEIRDAMLFVAGELDPSPGGSHPFPDPETWGFSQHAPFYANYPTFQRSIYLMQQRLKRHSYLALFDGADPNVPTAQRQVTTVPTQALYLMNSEFVHQRSRALAKRLIASDQNEGSRIQQAYTLVLGRLPTPQDHDQAARFLQRYRAEIDLAEHGPESQALQVWSALARTMLTRNEFLFVD